MSKSGSTHINGFYPFYPQASICPEDIAGGGGSGRSTKGAENRDAEGAEGRETPPHLTRGMWDPCKLRLLGPWWNPGHKRYFHFQPRTTHLVTAI